MHQLLSNLEIDELGDSYIQMFYDAYPNNSLCVDIEGFAEYLGLTIVYETFAGKDTDSIGFLADGKTAVTINRGGKQMNMVFGEKTIVIDKYLLRETESGRKRFTIAHEIAHYLIERMNPELAQARHHKEFDRERKYNSAELKQVLGFAENRADRLAAALIMPRFNMQKALDRFAEGKRFNIYGENLMTSSERLRMQVMADGIGVSFSALKIRLKELGFVEYHTFDELVAQDFQEGDFDDSDIDYDRRYGELSPEQIYLIHRSRREAERQEMRTVKCPSCGFRMATVTVGTNGNQQLKCRKCSLNENLNFAYFRKSYKPRASEPVKYTKKKR